MEHFYFPTAPVVYEVGTGEGKLCASCPAYEATCGGSESGSHPEDPFASKEVDQEALVRLRNSVGIEAYQYLVEQALPLAKRLKVLSPTELAMNLADVPVSSVQVPNSADPKGLARMYLHSLAKNLQTLYDLHVEKSEVRVEGLQLMFLIEAQKNCVAGILASIDATGRRTSAAGAAGRIKHGDRTKDRVREAAEPFRRSMTKEAAAVKLAPIVGKQRSTVLKLLSVLFPGDSWADGAQPE